jgi:hypothetical protein
MTQQPPPTGDHAHDPLDDGLPHKAADDREEIYYEGSPLLRGDFGKLCVAAIIAAVLIAIPILWNHYRPPTPMWAWIACIVLAVGVILWPVIVIRSVRYRITNYRIDYERGILSKNIDTLELWHIEDIRFHQSIFDRLVNVGDITVLSHDDTTPQLVLAGVPNPRPLFESLKQRVIAVKRQRGVVKMDIGQ